MKNNTEYRRLGRELTKGNILNLFLISLVFSAIIGTVTGIGATFGPTYGQNFEVIDAGNPAVAQLFNLIAILLSGYVVFGTTKTYIGVTKKQQPVIESALLAGVKEQPLKAPLLSFIQNILLGLWTLLFIIPGIVKGYSYAMSSFLLVQEPTLSSIDAITKSRKLMDGKKSQLFALDFSYFGWYVLSLFTFGILFAWVIPWHQTARTLFMRDAYQPDAK
jgi:uncharacterized membrane protein